MRLLLDTHTLLWWWNDDPRLSDSARQHILDEGNEVLASAASAWEIATKFRLGKLGLARTILPQYNTLLRADAFEALPILTIHALKAGSYPQVHRDPFDRILAAQAQIEKLTLVSNDIALDQFDVTRLW